MGAGFSITIGAVDTTSGIFAKVNKHLTELQAPAKRLSQQLTKFTELSGLKRVSNGFDGIVRSSLGAARSVARVSEPLAAITGAASIGGFTALIEKWAEVNTNLGFAAQSLGVMPSYLGQLRASGTLAGGSADAMQQGFANLSNAMYDMRNGQAPQLAYVFSRLGISMNATSKEAMPVLTAAIANMKTPLAQGRLAMIAFGAAGEGMLPVLRMTKAEIEENRQRVLRYGGVTDTGVAAALRFTQAQRAVGQSVVGLADAIETQLAPVISPLLLQFADWISHGRTSRFVMHDLGEDVKGVATWLRHLDFGKITTDVETFGDRVMATLRGLEGWRLILDKVLGIDPGPAIPAVSTPGQPGGRDAAARFRNAGDQGWSDFTNNPALQRLLPPEQRRQYDEPDWWRDHVNQPFRQSLGLEPSNKTLVANYLSKYWPRAQVAGALGNFAYESSFNPFTEGDKVNGQYTAYGIAQWHKAGQDEFARVFGHDMRQSNLGEQLAFLRYQLTEGSEKAAGARFFAERSSGGAGSTLSRYFERPKERDINARLRGMYAQREESSLPIGPTLPALADSVSSGAGTPGATGKVDVNVNVKSDGSSPKVTARGRGNVNTPRITTAMAGASDVVDLGSLY